MQAVFGHPKPKQTDVNKTLLYFTVLVISCSVFSIVYFHCIYRET